MFFSQKYFPVELVNQKIMEEIENLRKSRFFQEFDTISLSLGFGESLSERELESGSDELRSWGLAWCARLLSYSDYLDKAEKFLTIAKTLVDVPEIQIAEAFMLSQKGNKTEALQALAAIDTGASRSAGLMIVANHDGAEGAIQWMSDARYTVGDLDSDGKISLLRYQFQTSRWDAATQTAYSFCESDLNEAPILYHLAALAKLIIVVPIDHRVDVINQVPFDLLNLPLASDAVAMDARSAAHHHFLNGVDAVMQLGCQHFASVSDQYALWLELRDPAQNAHGKIRLKEKLNNPQTALAFVRYAIQFSIKLDLDEVERDIKRNIAINGGMTADAAVARFALAFSKPTPDEAANYLVHHHNELASYINPTLIQFRQIEMLSKAGFIEKANEVLGYVLEKGIPDDQESILRQIILEAQGNDPSEFYKNQYRSTGTLADLTNLVNVLGRHHHWEDVCEFGKLLFDETRSLQDAERLVNAFHTTQSSRELVEFLRENDYLLNKSEHLKILYAWGLYNEGALLESRAALDEVSAEEVSQNYSDLQVNLGITMGDWASLSDFIANEYRKQAR